MATAAPATDPKTEFAELTADSARLRTKLEADKKTLASLEDERARINEAIAAGKTAPERAGEIARRIETAAASVDGGAALLARAEKRLGVLRPIVLRQDAADRLAKSRAELAALKVNGEKIAARINEKLTAILTEDFPALDAVRDALAKFYTDGLNGPTEANRLIRLLKRADDVLVAELAVRKAKGSHIARQ